MFGFRVGWVCSHVGVRWACRGVSGSAVRGRVPWRGAGGALDGGWGVDAPTGRLGVCDGCMGYARCMLGYMRCTLSGMSTYMDYLSGRAALSDIECAEAELAFAHEAYMPADKRHHLTRAHEHAVAAWASCPEAAEAVMSVASDGLVAL